MAAWRAMTAADLGAVRAVADRVHPAYPEDAAVFAERLALHPGGCWVLDDGGAVVGYLIGHPWHERRPPPLNTMLGALPAAPSAYYIHDVAILPAYRRSGKAREIVAVCVARARAAGFAGVSLVAVNRSAPFWRSLGFEPVSDPGLDAELASYDAEARLMVCRL
jgi:ribosomal protein S18 acetylase RimI-like enzyme